MPLLNLPRVIRIEPSSRCNLKCIHCPTGTITMNRGLMSIKTFEKIIDQLRSNIEIIKVVVLYHGGEPLLNPLSASFIRTLKLLNPNIWIKTVSNGMLLTPSISDKLIRSGLNVIEFSLDGISPKMSQYIRKNNNTKKIVSNIKVLAEKIKDCELDKPIVYISSTQFLSEIPESDIIPDALLPEWLTDEFANFNIKFKINYAIELPNMRIKNEFRSFLSSNKYENNFCDNIINTITIRANGDVVPCCFDLTSESIMGNIHDNTLLEIYNNNKYKSLRNSIKKKTYISLCENCIVVKSPKYLIPNFNLVTL